MNYIDLLVVTVLALLAFWGYFRGAIKEVAELVVLVLSFACALLLYRPLFMQLPPLSILPTPFLLAICFFLLLFVFVLSFQVVAILLIFRLPITVTESRWTRYLGAPAAIIKYLVLLVVVLPVLTMMPAGDGLSSAVTKSFFSKITASPQAVVQNWVLSNFTTTNDKGIVFISLEQSGKDTIDLGYKVANPHGSSGTASRLRQILNNYRINVGSEKLLADEELSKVALSHAKYLAEKGILSHRSADNKEIADRLSANAKSFSYASELVSVGGDIDSLGEGLSASDVTENVISSPAYDKIGVAVINMGKNGVLAVVEVAK